MSWWDKATGGMMQPPENHYHLFVFFKTCAVRHGSPQGVVRSCYANRQGRISIRQFSHVSGCELLRYVDKTSKPQRFQANELVYLLKLFVPHHPFGARSTRLLHGGRSLLTSKMSVRDPPQEAGPLSRTGFTKFAPCP